MLLLCWYIATTSDLSSAQTLQAHSMTVDHRLQERPFESKTWLLLVLWGLCLL